MDLSALTTAPLSIQLHAYAAMGAFVLGAVQLARVKGTQATVRSGTLGRS